MWLLFWNDDLTAHENFVNQLSSAGVRGSTGYAAPEYAMGGEISVHGDAYSFGILIFEMISGKRPTDEIFGGDFTLRSCVRSALPEQVLDVADESVLHNGLRIGFPIAECLTKVLEVGLGCSEESPANRLGMSEHLEGQGRSKSSRKAKEQPPLPRPLNFDFENAPEKVSWSMANSGDEAWSPFLGEDKVQDS
ncbi:hypothetical protein HID58_051158, partial [Brassica napus]